MEAEMTHLTLDKHGWPVEQIADRPLTNWIRNMIHGKTRVCAECWKRSRSAIGTGVSQPIQVGNVLIYRDRNFGHHRYFEVLGVYLGSVNEESLVELRSIGEKPGHNGDTLRPTTLVPECLTWQMEIVQSVTELIK